VDASSAKTSTVVLGAHYDTVVDSPGANDNASGVALVLGVGLELLRGGGCDGGSVRGASKRSSGIVVGF
jgi:hypothetical protein